MQNQNRKTLLYQILLQALITFLYAFGFVRILVCEAQTGGLEALVVPLRKYLPMLVILICSLLPQASLMIKHKLHSQDGEILPLLFTVVALQASMITQDAVDAFGYYFEFPLELLVIQRFSLLGAASMFLLSSLRYFGLSSSHINLYNAAFLSLSFLIASLIPVSSYHGVTELFSSPYEVYLLFIISVVYSITILTFIIVAIKDKTALNIRRSASFIFLCTGTYLSHLNSFGTGVASIVLYLTGTLVLMVNAGDSF